MLCYMLCCLVRVSPSAYRLNSATVLSSCTGSFSCTNMMPFCPVDPSPSDSFGVLGFENLMSCFSTTSLLLRTNKLPLCARHDDNECTSAVFRNLSDILVLYDPFTALERSRFLTHPTLRSVVTFLCTLVACGFDLPCSLPNLLRLH